MLQKNKKPEKVAYYIDTNIALDYVTGRNIETVSVLDDLKKTNSVLISSSFLVMEAADFKKDSIYIFRKAVEENWEVRKILRNVYRKDLKYGDFCNISDWIEDLKNKLDLQLYDFLVDTDTWELAQYISENSNLLAPDVIHLCSAFIASQSGVEIGDKTIPCKVFISNDSFLTKEAEKIKEQLDVRYPNILTVTEIKRKIEKNKDNATRKRTTK